MKKVEFKFVKYEACGNDFVLKDERHGIRVVEKEKPKLAKKLCNRHFGIGADGVIFAGFSEKADARMQLFDPEDREAFMCGNGIRCVADYLYNELKNDKLLIDTRDGLKKITRVGANLYRVNMGRLRFLMEDMKSFFKGDFSDDEKLLDKELVFPHLGKIRVSIVNSGEPHLVIFARDIETQDIIKYGKNITQNFELFPHGVSTDLCEVTDCGTIKVRTYEAGVYYETLACGTGATACAGVAYFTNRVKTRKIRTITNGGEMTIEIGEDSLFMTGAAHKVFDGKIYLEI